MNGQVIFKQIKTNKLNTHIFVYVYTYKRKNVYYYAKK